MLLAGIFVPAEAAPRLLRFDVPVQDIGHLRYDAGNVKVIFEYVNVSDKPVTILDIHAQCGCTKPVWKRRAVAPGARSRVEVEYDPSSFIGEQNAHLTVISTNGDYKKFNTITVRSFVERDETLEQIRHPYILSPGLRSDRDAVGMRLSVKGEKAIRHFELYNDSEEPLISSALIVKALENAGIPRVIVFISTVAVYGCEFGENIDEDHPLKGDSPYAKSKIMAETYLTEWCQKHDVIDRGDAYALIT